MNGWHVLARIAWARLRCRVGAHQETTRIRGEYQVVYCVRCYAATVELVEL